MTITLQEAGQWTVFQQLNDSETARFGDLAYIAEDAMKAAQKAKPQAAAATVGGN
jgi:hypothetical protein